MRVCALCLSLCDLALHRPPHLFGDRVLRVEIDIGPLHSFQETQMLPFDLPVPASLACSEFTGCSSFGGDGTEFTG
jgi:hypothetical protein